MSQIIRLNSKVPTCPLCRELMERRYVLMRNAFVWECAPDDVRILVDDPMVGKWDAVLDAMPAEERPRCPRPGCDTPMRVFTNSAEFLKAKCPKKGCGAVMQTTEPDRLKTPTPGIIQ